MVSASPLVNSYYSKGMLRELHVYVGGGHCSSNTTVSHSTVHNYSRNRQRILWQKYSKSENNIQPEGSFIC